MGRRAWQIPGAQIPGVLIPGALIPGALIPGALIPGARILAWRIPVRGREVGAGVLRGGFAAVGLGMASRSVLPSATFIRKSWLEKMGASFEDAGGAEVAAVGLLDAGFDGVGEVGGQDFVVDTGASGGVADGEDDFAALEKIAGHPVGGSRDRFRCRRRWRSGRCGECSRKRPTTERTRMLSESPLTPGRRMQRPRMMRSIPTPACEAV